MVVRESLWQQRLWIETFMILCRNINIRKSISNSAWKINFVNLQFTNIYATYSLILWKSLHLRKYSEGLVSTKPFLFWSSTWMFIRTKTNKHYLAVWLSTNSQPFSSTFLLPVNGSKNSNLSFQSSIEFWNLIFENIFFYFDYI